MNAASGLGHGDGKVLGGEGRGVGQHDFPDPSRVVGAAGCEVTHVGGEEHARYVGGVRGEGADGDKGGDVALLEELPDVDVSLWVGLLLGLSGVTG